jgi:hypothetical protein
MFWFSTDAVQACACCSNRAQRYVEVEKLDDYRLGVIEQMAFAREAFVAEGADDHPVEVRQLGTRLLLTVMRTAKEIVLSFRGEQGGSTVVTLTMPGSISIFEVDPRGDENDAGLGPSLYKEWQLTASAQVAGALGPLARGGTATLILHGRGRSCTDAMDFTAWTLLIPGHAKKLTLYGALNPGTR